MALPLVPAVWAGLGALLLQVVGSLVGRVLLALSLSLVTFIGIGAFVSVALGYAKTSLTALPPDIVAFLGLTKIDVAITMVASAITGRMVVQGIQGGSLRRWVTK